MLSSRPESNAMSRGLSARLRRLEALSPDAEVGLVVIRARNDAEADSQVEAGRRRGEILPRDVVVQIALFGPDQPRDGFRPYRMSRGRSAPLPFVKPEGRDPAEARS